MCSVSRSIGFCLLAINLFGCGRVGFEICGNGKVAGDNATGDTDGDGTCDDIDNCLSDFNKIDPGSCGCGLPDVDTDGDTILDCFDIIESFNDGTTAPLASFNWVISGVPADGISYEVSIGSTAGSSDIANWVNVGTNTEHTFWNLQLKYQSTYHGNLRVIDSLGSPVNTIQGDGFTNDIKIWKFKRSWHSTCAMMDNLTVKCWGRNNWGQRGSGDTISVGAAVGSMATLVPVDVGMPVIAMSAQEQAFCAMSPLGKVKCWGGDNGGGIGLLGLEHTEIIGNQPGEMGANLPYVELGTGLSAVQIDSGRKHTCALLNDNTMKCWGLGNNGQLGSGNTDTVGDASGEMGDNLQTIDLGTNLYPIQFCSGGSFNCAILNNFELKCWGANESGQLGQGHTNNLGDTSDEMGDNLPVVDLGLDRTASQIACGSSFACAILDNNTVKCWGDNSEGHLGQGHTNSLGDNPNEMGNALPIVDLGSGFVPVSIHLAFRAACAIDANGTAKCWGYNAQGTLLAGHSMSLGDGVGEMGNNLPLIGLPPGRTIKTFDGNGFSMCAVLDDDTGRCWGYGSWGMLGDEQNISIVGDQVSEIGEFLPAIPLTFP